MIEVILLERVERLGQLGDVVKVRPGFARNFLLPQKKALRASKDNIAFFNAKKAEIEASNKARREMAVGVSSKIDGAKFVLIRSAGESGQLYGSVTARDVADAAVAAGFTVDRSMVQISTPIKALGLHQVKVRLHPEVTVNVTLNVARSAEEALVQAKTGQMVAANAEAAAAAAAAEVVATEVAAAPAA